MKPIKVHLKVTVSDTILTYLKFHTFITKCETYLYSRPFCLTLPDLTNLSVNLSSHLLVIASLSVKLEQDLNYSSFTFIDDMQDNLFYSNSGKDRVMNSCRLEQRLKCKKKKSTKVYYWRKNDYSRIRHHLAALFAFHL